jgi:hypothetical protein
VITKACSTCGRPALPRSTRCASHPKRWRNGSTTAWRTQRARILARDPLCWCGERAVEVHHLTDSPVLNVPDGELQGVCFKHNPRGG